MLQQLLQRFRFGQHAAGARHGGAPGAAIATDQMAGLDAFASEAEPAAKPAARSATPNGMSRVVPAVLGLLVLLQAGPTYFWLQGRLAAAKEPAPVAESAAATPSSFAEMPTPTSGVAAGCAPAAEPPAASPPPARPERRTAAAGAAAAAPTVLAGLLAVQAPVPMQVLQAGRIVGTTEAATIMLAPGKHDLEFANDEVGLRVRRTVTLQAGRTTSIEIEAPAGALSINALPWAEVWIDDKRAGETPIGNLQAPIGRRQIVFRHPELGERRTSVLVTLKAPARVSMDLRQR